MPKIEFETTLKASMMRNALGTSFVGLLSQENELVSDNPELVEKLTNLLNLLKEGTPFFEKIDSESGFSCVATSLRESAFPANLIHGINIFQIDDKTVNGVLKAFGISISVPPTKIGDLNFISDSIEGRGFCLLFLGTGSMPSSEEPTLLSKLKILSKVAGVVVVK